MSNPGNYITEAKELINHYGLQAFAKVLNRTERGIQYWFDENPKKPGLEMQKKIHELFVKHKNGNSLVEQQEAKHGTNGIKQDYLSGKNLENFSEAQRVLAETNRFLITVRGQPKNSQDQTLVQELYRWLQEFAGGKKTVSVDDLKKELQKASTRDNSYTQ